VIKVGVIGLGMMGLTHLDVYQKEKGVKVVAISDLIPERLTGKVKAAGNIKGQAKGGFDYDSVKQYDEGMKLIRDPEIDLVDICIPTPAHVKYAIAAFKAGKHVMCEKPTARHYKDALKLIEVAEKSKKFSMIGQCMRFWPGWVWLKDRIEKKTYGKLLSATFRRVAEPVLTTFYPDGRKSGGAILDLHIHDVDFIQWCLGMPKSVSSVGYSLYTGEIDHVSTQYAYPKGPMVTAEGGWVMQGGHGFKMFYNANFQRATAVFDLDKAPTPLTLYRKGKAPEVVKIPEGMGYTYELRYLLNCIRKGVRPTTVTVRDAAKALRIVEAESRSAKTGKPVKL